MKRIVCTPLSYNFWPEYARICGKMLVGGETGWLYLAPTRQLLARIQDGIYETKDLFGFSKTNLLTIDRLVELVLERADFSYIYLEETEALPILDQVLKQLAQEGKLECYYKAVGKYGYLSGLYQALGELKRYLISPWRLKEAGEQLRLSGKEQELALIYAVYQKTLEKMGYFQQEDLYLKAIDCLKERGSELLAGFNNLFMSNYFEFTPIKFDFLAQVIALIPRVEINLSYDRQNPEAYQLTKRTLKQFERLGLEVNYLELGEQDYLGKEAVKYLFSGKKGVIDNKNRLQLASFRSKEEEVRGIAREIKRLIIKDNYEPGQICLVPRTVQDYLNLAIRIFNEYGIPIGFSQELNLVFHPLARDVFNLYRLKIEGINRDNLLRVALSSYLGGALGLGERNLNLISSGRLIMEGKDWLELVKEEGDSLKGITEIINLVNSLPEKGTCKEYAQIMLKFLEQLPLDERILRLNTVRMGDDWLKGLKTDLMIRKKLLEVLAGFDHPLYDLLAEFRINNFLELFYNKLSSVSITKTEGEEGGVQLFDPSALRGQQFEVVFLPGLEEGNFPRYPSENWVLSEQVRTKFRSLDLRLPNREDQEIGEQFFLASAISSAKNKLYLSYSIGQSSEERLKSWFVEEITELFSSDQSGHSSSFGTADLSAAASWRELIGWFSMFFPRGGREALEKAGLQLPAGFLSRIEAESARWNVAALGFTEYNGNLQKREIKERLGKHFGENRIYSAGQFREYASCPFGFFLRRVLGLKPSEEVTAELGGLEKGTIYHEVLARFLGCYKNKILQPDQQDIYLEQLKRITETVLAEEQFCFLNKNPRWPVLKKLLERDLEKWLVQEFKYNEDDETGFTPLCLEWSFGLPLEGKEDEMSTESTLDLEEDGKILRLCGRIDRIDYSQQGFYQALDYKTSLFPDDNDLMNLLDLQIPIYLLAIRELLCQKGERVLGGGYYSLKTGQRGGGIWQWEHKDRIPHKGDKKTKGDLDENEWDSYFAQVRQQLADYREGIASGKFELYPKKCSPYCDFKTICRFDPLQVAELGGEIDE